jgi:hypothetical protein
MQTMRKYGHTSAVLHYPPQPSGGTDDLKGQLWADRQGHPARLFEQQQGTPMSGHSQTAHESDHTSSH